MRSMVSAVGIPRLQAGEDVKDGTKREWPAMMQVSYDEPMKYSEEPMAKMEKSE